MIGFLSISSVSVGAIARIFSPFLVKPSLHSAAVFNVIFISPVLGAIDSLAELGDAGLVWIVVVGSAEVDVFGFDSSNRTTCGYIF